MGWKPMPLRVWRTKLLYACKIKETTDGGWRSARGQTRGKPSKSSLRGASREMAISMSEKQLRDFAKTKRKKLPRKKT
jgi:Protein of unknwon function (DUF3008)